MATKLKARSGMDSQVRVGLDFLDENGEPEVSLTEQHHKDSCDITQIIRQYDKTGLISHVNEAKAMYGDFTETVNEYQQALNLVMNSQTSFMELPSTVRKRFGNDPGAFLEFATNPENIPELQEMGLAEKTEPVTTTVTTTKETPAEATTEGN